MSVNPAWAGMTRPGHSRGLLDVWSRRYLLRLLVRKDMQVRYRGSVLGWAWSYVKPAFQFLVYFIAMGVFLGLNKSLPNYPVYLFSGLVIMNYFNEAFMNSTRSVIDNTALVKKIYLPRELFPVSSVIIAFVNFFPQLVVLMAAAILVGYHPTVLQVGFILLSILIITILAMGLGLIFGAINVSLRDSQNIVELIMMFTTWLSPVLYNAALVDHVFPGWALILYNLNPITGAVGLIHLGAWAPTTSQDPATMALVGPHILIYGLAALVTSLVILLLGELVFRKLEKNFAQDL
ncbi:MAG: ABC transporter permease [Microbacteriaceae bacterium]|jgi:ABC-2 type transport system permease protein|nr:ABC transporter permease [Microbacteriaceae bacterium]